MPPLLVTLSLMLATRSLSPCTAGRSVSWWRGDPGPTAVWPTTDRWRAEDPQRTQQLELIEHVLRNNKQWARVLQMGIKLTPNNWPPPYHADDDPVATDQEVRTLLKMVDKDATHLTPLPVLQRAAQLRWLGSYVDYATYVTRSAFLCLGYGNARLALYLAWRIWAKADMKAKAANPTNPPMKEVNPLSVVINHGMKLTTIRNLKLLLATISAKTAAMHSDLSPDVDALFSQVMAGLTYENAQNRLLANSFARMEDYVNERCAPISQTDEFLNAGLSENTESVRINANTLEHLQDTFDLVVARVIETYEEFDLEAVPLSSWASVMDYEHPVVKSKRFLNVAYRSDPFDVETYTTTKFRKAMLENVRKKAQEQSTQKSTQQSTQQSTQKSTPQALSKALY